LKTARKPNTSEEFVLQLVCDESCLGYAASKNRLDNLKAVCRAGKRSVVVKRGTYIPVYSNYRMNEHNL